MEENKKEQCDCNKTNNSETKEALEELTRKINTIGGSIAVLSNSLGHLISVVAEILAEQGKVEDAESLNDSALLLVHARDESTKEFQPEVYAASKVSEESIALMILKGLLNQ